MARSGTVVTTKYAYSSTVSMGLKCTWEIVSQSAEHNRSTIAWTLASEGGSGFQFYTALVSLLIDGQNAYNWPDRFLMNGGGEWSVSGSVVVEHDPDGTKDLEISIAAGIYVYGTTNCTGSDTFELTPIERGLSFIDSGISNGKYQAFIDNGSKFVPYIPEKDSGAAWNVMS